MAIFCKRARYHPCQLSAFNRPPQHLGLLTRGALLTSGMGQNSDQLFSGGLQTFNLPQGGSGGDYAASGEETQHIWTRARVPGKGITEKVPRSHAGSRLRHGPLCNFRLGSRGQAGRLPERSLSKVSKLQWDFRSPFGHLRKTGLV